MKPNVQVYNSTVQLTEQYLSKTCVSAITEKFSGSFSEIAFHVHFIEVDRVQLLITGSKFS